MLSLVDNPKLSRDEEHTILPHVAGNLEFARKDDTHAQPGTGRGLGHWRAASLHINAGTTKGPSATSEARYK